MLNTWYVFPLQFKSIEALSTATKGRILQYENHDLFHSVTRWGMPWSLAAASTSTYRTGASLAFGAP